MQRITPLVILTVLLVSAAAPAVGQAGLVANAGPDKSANTGDAVSFDGTSSTGSIASYNWDFGDGSTASGAAPSHAFGAAGTFTVTLVVIGTAGATSTDTALVTVHTADAVAPNVTTYLPTGVISGSPTNVTAYVTDNVGVANVTLYYKTGTDTTFNSTTMACTGATAINKTCAGVIPGTVTSASLVQYYVRATDTRTPTANVGTYPSNAPTGTLNLTLQDTTAPTITVNAPLTTGTATAGTDLTVNVTITDNAGVTAAQVFYVYAIDSVVPSFGTTNASLTRASGNGLNGTWTTTIPMDAGNVTANTTDLAFYVRATDGTNNATLPANAPSGYRSVGIVQATAPIVAHTPPTSATAGVALPITATVTANGAALANVTVWYRSAGTTAFQVQEMTGTGTYSATIPGANVTDTGVEYYLRANTSSASAFRITPSAANPYFIGTPPTSTVAGLAATRVGGGVNVAWTALASTGTASVGGYRVWRGPDAGNLTQLANVTGGSASSFLDDTPTIGFTAFYTVSAYDNASTEDGRATPVSLVVRPDAPGHLNATADAIGSLLVSYDTVRSGARYVVESSPDGSTWSTAANTTDGSTSVSLTAGTLVHLRVRSLTSTNVSSAASGEITATPLGAAATPTGLAGSRVSGGISLSWTNASTSSFPVTGNYSIQRSTTSTSAGFTDLANAPTTSFTDTTAGTSATYFYRVAARNAFGLGSYSSAITVAPPSSGGGGGGGGSPTPTPTPVSSTPVTSTPVSSTPVSTTKTTTTTPSVSTPSTTTTTPTKSTTTTTTTTTPTKSTSTTTSTTTTSTPKTSSTSTTTTSTPAAVAATPAKKPLIPGFEVVALTAALAAAALVLVRRRN